MCLPGQPCPCAFTSHVGFASDSAPPRVPVPWVMARTWCPDVLRWEVGYTGLLGASCMGIERGSLRRCSPRKDVGQGSLLSCRAWKETGKHRGLAGHEKGCPERKQARQIITEGCCGELMSSICLETEAGRQRLGGRRPWLVAPCQWGRWAAGLGTAAGT